MITWSTDEPSSSQVEYGTTTSYGQSTAAAPALVTSHTQSLSGLTPGTDYHFRVKSADAAGNLATSGDSSFTTALGATLFCHIEAPTSGSTVSGVVPVSITATGGTGGVQSVQLKLDGNDLGAPLTSAPYSSSWDTGAASNGSHTLAAVATDGSGAQTTSDPVTVTVANAPLDTTPPVVSGQTPASGATGVSVSVKPTATFSEAVQPATISFSVKDAGNVAVLGASSYDAPSRTATFTPSAALTSSAVYTATMSGRRTRPATP